jgi:hypothetical protein
VEDVRGRASVTRAVWRLLGAARISQIGISVVEQGVPVLPGFIKAALALVLAVAFFPALLVPSAPSSEGVSR